MPRRPTSPRARDELGDIASAAAERTRVENETPLPLGVDHRQTELRRIETLKPFPANARTHSDKQVAQIVRSMREFGWTIPILVDEDDMIIAGHGRIMAAQRLALAEAPVIVARGWTAEQKRAYVLADNQLALNAGWNKELLAVELQELNLAEFNLDLIGFNPKQLESLLNPDDVGGDEVFQDGAIFEVIVTCASEQEQAALLDRLAGEGMKCRALLA